MHDFVGAPVEFLQRLALILLELVPEGCLRSYPRDCCHHHSILLGIMNYGQLVIETLDISLHHFVGSLLDPGQMTRGIMYLCAPWN